MRYFLLSALITLSHFISGQSHLSEKAQISVITCAPYQGELYSAFGHSAIRVYDPDNSIDYAYNYGVFDFNQPNFYLNFTKGHLLYKLAVQPYPRFKEIYLYYGRWVHEQVIDLNAEQRKKMFEYLQWNARPENQNYLYDYFYNNCATKIRDVFKEVLGDEINFDGSYITTNYTIRDLTDIYLEEQPWGNLGIDICLGLPMDKRASPYEYMFLPDYVESSFNHATITLDGQTKAAVITTIVSDPQYLLSAEHAVPHPWLVFGVFLAIVLLITLWDYKRNKLSVWLDFTLMFVTGIVGCLLFVLWVATDHKAAATNFNLLWAIPFNLFFAFTLFGKPRKIVVQYLLLLLITTLLLLVSWAFLPQQLNVFLLPVVIALAIRYAINYWIRRKLNYM